MALVLNDRVKETSTSTGTGTINLAGAVSGFEGFVAGIGSTNTTYYAIAHQSANEWEVGIGTITDATPDTLARTTVLSSSNSDSAVNFTAGTKDVFCTYPAGKAVFKDASDNTNFADSNGTNNKVQFGDSSELQIFHNGSNGYISGNSAGDNTVVLKPGGSGSVLITNSSSDNIITQQGDSAYLHYNGNTKLQTTNTGVRTTGNININGEYAFPTTDGNANQILETDGSGALTFVDKPTAGASAGFVIAMAVAL